jgi:hypothetical protein
VTTPALKKEESVASAKLQREQSSSLKLQRVESAITSNDNEVRDLLIGNKHQGQQKISELEPFLL